MEVRHTGTKKWKRIRKQDGRRILEGGFFFLVDYIDQDTTGELEKERENMMEKRERVTVAATETLMPIYCILLVKH